MALQTHPSDRFVGAQIERSQQSNEAFDAGQYSFFGDLSGHVNGALGGALEDGLEAPPDEDGLGTLEEEGELEEVDIEALREDDEGDLSMAGIFRTAEQDYEELDSATLARSLPKNMFGDDDPVGSSMRLRSPPAQHSASRQQPEAWTPSLYGPPPFHLPPENPPAYTPQPMHHHELPTPPRMPMDRLFPQHTPQQAEPPLPVVRMSTPMTIAELEAQLARGTPGGQGAPPPPHITDTRPPPPPGMDQGYPHFHGSPMPQGGFPGHSPQPLHHRQLPRPDTGMHGPGPGMLHPMHSPGGPGMIPGHGMDMGHMPSPPPHNMYPGQGPGMQPGGPMMMNSSPYGGRGGVMPPPVPPAHLMPPHMRPGGPHMTPPPPHGHMQGMHSPGPAWSVGPPGGMSPGLVPHPGPGHMMTPPVPPPGSHMSGSGGRPPVRYGGKWMSGSEVDHVMSIMFNAVNSGVPYKEDYYYQAFINKHAKGRNGFVFKPETLRSLRPDVVRLDPSAFVRFAAVDGLGKIVLSNIRTPKVLMDLTSAPEEAAGSNTGADNTSLMRPLEQEPLLAARIMVEDCYDKLLDVDDIDRCFAAAAQRVMGALPEEPASLHQRRALLAMAITNAFRLPMDPAGASDAADARAGDAVFSNLMSLPKGRAMLARAVHVLLARSAPGGSSAAAIDTPAAAKSRPDQLLWALLRNCHQVFGTSISDPDIKAAVLNPLVEATHKLAAACKDAIHHLSTQEQLVATFTALITCLKARSEAAAAPTATVMDDVLPLAQVRKLNLPLPDSTPTDWLSDILIALLQKGTQLMPTDGEGAGSPLLAQWQAGVSVLLLSFQKHVSALAVLQQGMASQAAAQGSSPAPEAVQAVTSLACRPLAQQLLGYISDVAVSDKLKHQLRQLLM